MDYSSGEDRYDSCQEDSSGDDIRSLGTKGKVPKRKRNKNQRSRRKKQHLCPEEQIVRAMGACGAQFSDSSVFDSILSQFETFSKETSSESAAICDGILKTLLSANCTRADLRLLLKVTYSLHIIIYYRSVHSRLSLFYQVGNNRLSRVAKGLEKRTRGGKNGIQLQRSDVDFFKAHFESFETEVGASSCKHVSPRKVILPIRLHLLNGIKGYNTVTIDTPRDRPTLTIPTWENIYQLYRRACEEKKVRCMGRTTWFNYRQGYFSDYYLEQPSEDLCDTCNRLNLVINDVNSTEEEKELARACKDTHTERAVIHQRLMKDLLSRYGKKVSREPGIDPFDLEFWPTYCDSKNADIADSDESKLLRTGVLLELQDYAGNFVLPSFGEKRPGSDYYSSRLHMNAFVIGSPSTNKHKVYCYDERCGGKGLNEQFIAMGTLSPNVRSVQEV